MGKMSQAWNIKDLLFRLLAISLTSLILLFVTHDTKFDLHFKIRKTQKVNPDILIVEIPLKLSTETVIRNLIQKKIRKLYVSHFIFDQADEIVSPYIVDEIQDTFLSIELTPDPDGLVRKVKFLKSTLAPFYSEERSLNINYRGKAETFPTINYYDLKDEGIDLDNKIIILKSSKIISTYTTPLGLISEAEMVATLIDNQELQRFLPEKSFLIPLLILFLLLCLTTGFLIYLPSTLALLSSIAVAVAYISLSLWFFDVFYFWTPISIPLIQILLTFILISNYKFVLNEKTRWSLEKESHFINQVEEMKTNFLSLFSHDLKTPLAKIIGIVDTLRSQIDDPDIVLELEKIQNSSQELDTYIKRILKMSQVQSKNIALKKEPVDINTLIQQSVEQIQYSAHTKNINIELKLSPLFMVEVDGSLIKEVLVNFLENAIKYSPENKTVTVISEELENFIKVSVIDQGNGIPSDIQGQIWEKSFRFDKSQSGYGLGLFLSRYVVELHRGQVFLNSRENIGSEFGFLLPLDEDEKNETT